MNKISVRNALLRFVYTKLVKPIFFTQDPEKVHDRAVRTGRVLGRYPFGRSITRVLFGYKHPMLEQTIHDVLFPNPIGLAAGFDKNAQLTDILPSVGFGFAEVGSVTGEECSGNEKPRLWRLPKSKSLVVYYGLMNDGADAISKRLTDKHFRFPVGISVAKTNSPDTCQLDSGVADYAKAFSAFTEIGDYITINISCPNVFGGEPFTHPERLEKLLERLDTISYEKAVFIKLAADLSDDELNDILDVAARHRVHGFVCTNLAKDRNNQMTMQKVKEERIPDKGGMSGKVVAGLATDTIRRVYTRTRGAYTIIGVGGVFSAEDAYEKIKAGASLLQLITGMIYMGPQVISEINQGLVELLKKDGYKNISEAVGADVTF
ncbi:MAG: quinone-dependent dihydroorotate dehydrogenase [Patescibacteria group bacterium]